ncbi:MAG: hypothetical protein M1834_009450 [Cirrosporium novae-zelandiae]|nr:MAG: hypothetical protein M1834_009450 [Cirrosporium novae-zelandiae]
MSFKNSLLSFFGLSLLAGSSLAHPHYNGVNNHHPRGLSDLLPTGILPTSLFPTGLFPTGSGISGSPFPTATGTSGSCPFPFSINATYPLGNSSISLNITSSCNSTNTSTTDFLRGVNVGSWLILEEWMVSDMFSGDASWASDEWTFDQTSEAESALQKHWSTYFTEADVQTLKAAGINALRIPIGFWAYDNSGTPYLKGADAWLEKAIGWARAANMKVWVDCHGSPGSQNGYDNSGHAGEVTWQQGDNLNRSISVLKTMAKKYGSVEYADTVAAIEIVNEPISWGNNSFETTQEWAEQAYYAIKAVATNKNLMVVTHDSFQQPSTSWGSVAATLNVNNSSRLFGVDTHLYQVFEDADNTLNQAGHIQEACGWATDLTAANDQFPTFVGEWSPATNICVNSDGTTTNGTSCSTDGCQCESADVSDWNDNMVEQVRRFVEAQLDVFESSTSGYFMWSWDGPGAWSFKDGIQYGFIPNPVTSRKYAGQCS